jgi:hypothetical protein
VDDDHRWDSGTGSILRGIQSRRRVVRAEDIRAEAPNAIQNPTRLPVDMQQTCVNLGSLAEQPRGLAQDSDEWTAVSIAQMQDQNLADHTA